MNRYVAAPLTGLFIILVGSVIVSGVIDHLMFSYELDERVAIALGLTGLLGCLFLGIQFGLRRARMDRPWRLTRFHKVVMFVLAYVAVRIVWSYIKSYIGLSILAGARSVPSMEIIYLAVYFDRMVRLPLSAVTYTPLQNLERDHEFEFFFVNGVLLVVLGLLAIMVVKKLRARLMMSRRAM